MSAPRIKAATQAATAAVQSLEYARNKTVLVSYLRLKLEKTRVTEVICGCTKRSRELVATREESALLKGFP